MQSDTIPPRDIDYLNKKKPSARHGKPPFKLQVRGTQDKSKQYRFLSLSKLPASN